MSRMSTSISCRSRACCPGAGSSIVSSTSVVVVAACPVRLVGRRLAPTHPSGSDRTATPLLVALRAAPPGSNPSSSTSNSNDDDAPSSSMSAEDAALILGLSSSSPSSSASSFDDILARKNRLLAAAGSDKDRTALIEQAYDVMFMQSMRKRLTGNVSTNVRFADVGSTSRRGPGSRTQVNTSSKKMPSFTSAKMPGGLGLALAPPSNQQVATQQAAIFSVLAAWALIQAIAEPPVAQMGDTAGTQLSLALAYSVYTLKENKRLGIGKAVGLSLAGLVFWALLGTAVQSWLRVDIVPLGSFQSPGVFCTEFVITGLLLGALFVV